MKNRIVVAVLLLTAMFALPAWGRNYILRPALNVSALTICDRYGLSLIGSVDDGAGAVYLVSAPDVVPPDQVIASVSADVDVLNLEEDKILNVPETLIGPALNQSTTALLDQIGPLAMVNHFGQQVLNIYVSQPATGLIRLNAAQTTFAAYGAGATVAIVDTGIDPTHPALQNSIVPGYDFVHKVAGTASEWADVAQSTTALLDQSTTALLDKTAAVALNQSTTALLDQSTTALLDTQQLPKAFGHGTMVAGLVHLTAPLAKIMPLKAFTADGNANLSDILQAIYYAADHGANVINLSFSLLAPSIELEKAVYFASNHGAFCVASTGNTGLPSVALPAAAPKVIAVASTTNSDTRSSFSAYGTPTWVAAPGEGVVTTYPGGHYAAAWGTSFSAPLVSGGVALTVGVRPTESFSNARKAIAQAQNLTPDLGYGRLDLYQAVQFAEQ